MTRILALDYGSARCGCAVSDFSGEIASPLADVERPDSEAGMDRLVQLVAEVEAERIVVGLPLNLSGAEGEQADKTLDFIARLQARLSVPIETYDERFTSKLAQQTISSVRAAGAATAGAKDSIAAAHLLTSYLEARKRS